MNNIYKSVAVLILSAASISAIAKEKPMHMGMSEEMKDKQAREKQNYILKIDDLSDQIQEEKNAQKKQALMDEQLQVIKDHLEKKRMMKKKMMKKHMKMMGDKKSMKM